MNFLRTSFWNATAVGTRMAAALLLNKILALYVGPAGYAIIGQFQNAMAMALGFASGAVGNGVTKATAEFHEEPEQQHAVWQTAGSLVLLASLLSSALIAVFRLQLARFFLGASAAPSIFLWLAASLTLISLNGLLLAILNGKKDVRRYVVSSILGSITSAALVGVLAWQYGLYGALVALSLQQAIVFFVTLQQIATAPWFKISYLAGPLRGEHALTLAKFAVMAGTTAVAVPLSLVLIRNHLAHRFGWDYAGYWDAMWKLSTLYLSFVTTTLSLYYLPRIAEIRSNDELRREIVHVLRYVLPIVLCLSCTMYLARGLLVHLLFSSKFQPMTQLFAWQLAGDVVKMVSWVLSFVMLGRGMMFLFVISELGFSLLFWGLSVYLTNLMGFVGVSAAYFAAYTLYLGTMYYWILYRPRRAEMLA